MGKHIIKKWNDFSINENSKKENSKKETKSDIDFVDFFNKIKQAKEKEDIVR